MDKNLVIRAEEFIDAHCMNLSTIQEIADRLNTSSRNLQLSFKKYRDYTPMQFLRESKLKRAHKIILQKRDSNVTVKEVAISVGIFDLNRFGKYYLEQFGELPSETIRKAVR